MPKNIEVTTLYINEPLYTDVHSYRVVSISLDGNTAQVVKVRRESRIKPECIVGGFCCHVTNNREMYLDENSDIIDDGDPFEIVRRKSRGGRMLWGTQGNVVLEERWLPGVEEADGFITDTIRAYAEKGVSVECGSMMNGSVVIVSVYRLNKDGSRRRAGFHPLGTGVMEPRCLWYYDMNF